MHTRILLALTAAVMLVVGNATHVFAQTSNCSAVVVDDTKAKVLGNRLSDVQSAAETLQNRSQGTVRVLLAETTNQNAKAFRENVLQKQCPNDWGDGSGLTGTGHAKSDLLAIIIGMSDQKDNVFAGPAFASRITPALAEDIRVKTLESQLGVYARSNKKDTNALARGVIDSLGRMQTLVLAPPPASSNSGASAPRSTSSAPAGPPPDLTWLRNLIIVVVVIVGTSLLVVFIRRLRREDQEEAEDRQEAQRAVASAKNKAIRNVTGLDTRATALKDQMLGFQGKVPAEVYARLQHKVKTATDKADAVAIAYGGYNSDPLTSASDWNALARDGEQAFQLIRDALAACDTLERDPNATLLPPPGTPQSVPEWIGRTPAAAPVQRPAPPPPTPAVSRSTSDGEWENANLAYDEAHRLVVSAQRDLLEGSRYTRESRWDDLDEARRELEKAENARTANSKLNHSRQATRIASDVKSDIRADVVARVDRSNERWYRRRVSSYDPYDDNRTVVVYQPIFVPETPRYEPRHHVETRRDEPAASSRGSDSSGSWGESSRSSGSESSGSWGSSSGSSSGSDSSGSWGSSSSGSDSGSSPSSYDSGSSGSSDSDSSSSGSDSSGSWSSDS